MLATGIIFLVLGLAGALVSDYAKIFRRAAPRERYLDVLELGIERICSEVGSAVEVTTPTTVTTGSLRFIRINPTAARLPDPLPDPLPATWNFRQPSHLLTVTYQVAFGNLERRVTAPGLSTQEVICRGLSGMSVTRVAPRQLRIDLSIDINGANTIVSREAILWIDR